MGQRQTLTFGLDEIEGIEEITFGLDEIELEGPRPYRPGAFRLPRAETALSPTVPFEADAFRPTRTGIGDQVAAPSTFDDSGTAPRPPDFRVEVVGTLPKDPQEPDEPILARLPKNAVRALGAGVLRFNMGFWGGLEAAGDVLGLPSVASWAKQRGGEAGTLAKAVRGPQRGAGPTEQAVYGGFESLGLSVPTLLAGAATANPATSLALFGSVTAGEAYATARSQGVPIAQAVSYAVSQGAIEAATEKIPASRLLRDLTGRRGLGRTLLRQLTTEIPNEQAATAFQDLNDWAVLNTGQPLSRYLATRPSAAAQTLVSTLVATIGQTAGLAAAERVLREKAQATPETTTEPPPPLRAQTEPITPETPIAPTEVPLPAPVEVLDPIAAQFGGERVTETTPEITFRPEEIEQEEPRAVETGLVTPSNQPEYQGTPEVGPQAEPGDRDRALERPAAAVAEEEAVTEPVKAWTRAAVRDAYIAANPTEGSTDAAAVQAHGERLGRLADIVRRGPWQQARAYAAKGPPDVRARAANNLDELVRLGVLQRAWDAEGNPQYGPAGVARPTGLLTESEADTLGGANVAPAPIQTPNIGARAAAPAVGTVSGPSDQPSAPGRRLSKTRQREADLVTHAQQRGYTGDPAVLSDALTSRAQIVREINQEVDAAGATPAALLRAIREGGGISEQAETGQKGEIRWLKESLLKQAQGGKIFRKAGLTWDGMVEYLQQDPRFQHITDINDLVEELTDIAQGVSKDPGVLSARALGATGEQWWDRLLPASEPDVTDTGEIQPRLPEAGAVREQEQSTPTFEAPFSLTGEAAERAGVQPSLIERLDKLEAEARARLATRGTFAGARVSAGLPVDDLADLAVIGATKIAKGAVQFGQWSAEMIAEFGETIKPHLQTLYKQAQRKSDELRPTYLPSGRGLPPARPIEAKRVLEFPSLQKMPEPIRQDLADLLARHQGFQGQRRDVQPWARTQEVAKDVWLPLETLRPGTALNAEELEAYKTAVATALTERQTVLERIKAGEATDWDRLQFSYLTDVATILTASYRGAKAEAGRALNILRSKARILELQESRFLEAALRAPGFHQDVQKVADAAVAAAGDPLAQLKILRQRASGTWFDYVQAFYYTNLLSGMKSHERNTIGNSSNVGVNLLVPIGAAPVDFVRALRTGSERTVFLGEIPRALLGSVIGFDQGMRAAAFTMRYGFRPSTVEAAAGGKFDTPRIELPGGLWTNWPGRALEASDEFFRAIARQQERYAGAYAQARREGVRRDVTARMATILTATNPKTPDGKLADEINERAERFAARAVFQEDPGGITTWLLKAKAPSAPLPLRAAALFISPFIKTPAAILRQGLEWSPAGFAMKGAKDPGREGSQAIGRAVLGSAFMLAPVAWLAATGRLTGAPPDDPGDREEFYAQGKLANAVKIGRYWVRYNLFQPFSVPLAAVANAWNRFQDSEQDEGAAEEAFLAGAAGAGASLLDQSFLSGLGTLLDAINDPQRSAGRWLNLFAQGWVPYSGLLRNVTQATDPFVRRPEGVGQSVQAIIPGQSDSLRPRRTRFGEPVQRPGPWWQRGFMVPEVSREIDDRLTTTLARLKLRPVGPRPTLTLKGERVKLTRQQEDVLTEALGRERKVALEVVIGSSGFPERFDDAQREDLEQAMSRAGREVRVRALRLVQDQQPFTVDELVSARVRERVTRDRAAVFGQEETQATGTGGAR